MLALMAYHESTRKPCQSALDSAHVRNRKMFKTGMSYPDLLEDCYSFASNPVPTNTLPLTCVCSTAYERGRRERELLTTTLVSSLWSDAHVHVHVGSWLVTQC